MFCDATGVTKAHVFAESWTSCFDEPNDTREHEVVHRYTDPGTGEQRVLKRAKTFALWSRKVCGRTCNSGWLRELEERLRPVMAAFAAGTPIVLGRDEQADLALWAVAATLIAMSNDPEAKEFADPEVARRLYQDRRPSPGMDIWLGGNSHGEMAWFGSHTLNLRDAPSHRGAWGASITFGYAVIHLVCHDLPEQRMCLKGDAHKYLRRIWGPSDRVAWPPKKLIKEFDLSPLAIAIGEQCYFQRAVRRAA
jgi:hypothetical protein